MGTAVCLLFRGDGWWVRTWVTGQAFKKKAMFVVLFLDVKSVPAKHLPQQVIDMLLKPIFHHFPFTSLFYLTGEPSFVTSVAAWTSAAKGFQAWTSRGTM